MSGQKLQTPCLDGDYKSLPKFNWGQIKKKVWGYFLPQFGDLSRVLRARLSPQAERQLLKWIFMLVASNHKALCSLVFVLQILITPKLLFVEGGRKPACSSVPHVPQFPCLKRYTQTRIIDLHLEEFSAWELEHRQL